MGELLREVLRAITAEPGRFAAEVVQGVVLAGLIAWFGWRPLRRKLDVRRARIEAELEGAEAAERDVVRLREEAAALAGGAVTDPVAAAREQAGRDRAAALEQAEADARLVLAQAAETVAREHEAIRQETADRLVRLTTETARRYVDEMLGEAERRAVTQRAILESLAELERGHDAP